jgi:hypothetical protein
LLCCSGKYVLLLRKSYKAFNLNNLEQTVIAAPQATIPSRYCHVFAALSALGSTVQSAPAPIAYVASFAASLPKCDNPSRRLEEAEDQQPEA